MKTSFSRLFFGASFLALSCFVAHSDTRGQTTSPSDLAVPEVESDDAGGLKGKATWSCCDTSGACGACDHGCGHGCGGCGDGCGCGCGWDVCWFPETANRFCDFISPITNQYYFEDPRALTELRAIYARHIVPPALGSGTVQVFALQARAAVTERLSVIATKDGFFTSSNPLMQDGWADINAGVKYLLYADDYNQRLASAGLTFELPVGSPRALQGNGDGMFHLFLTGGTQVLDRGHWISASGFLLPTDPGAESSVWYWSNHFDYMVTRSFYLLTEFNWYNWMRAGTTTPLNVEGLDVFNLGSQFVAGNDIVTGAFGGKLKPSNNVEIGLAWEVPLTERRDILDNRLTADLILRY